MIRLYDKDGDKLIGEITDEQFDFLDEHLEEESPEDEDYYLNRTMIDVLEEQGGAAELIALLRNAMGDREEIEIRWEDAGEG